PVLRLSGAGVVLAEEFTELSGLRELRDGRVLVTDVREGRLVVTDFKAGTVRQIGRKGSGPGEYRQVARIWALGGDSTLVKEPYAPRWMMLVGDKVVATIGASDPALTAVAMGPLQGSDAVGRVYATTLAKNARGVPSIEDPLVLIRVDRRSARVDTMARLQHEELWKRGAGLATPPMAERAAGGVPNAPKRYSIALMAPDQVAVFADSWVAIARPDPYRVDWCRPDGRCTEGKPLGYEKPAMTTQEKQAYLDAAKITHSWPPTTKVDETANWPSYVPPFASPSGIDGSAVLAMPDGRAMVARLPSAAARMHRYDIVSRAGVIEAQLQLPLQERVVGFGAKTIYVSVIDTDGVQRLRRHAWP
ncbi:MAG: hypothetical protein IT357_12955, partial [Gemmatimonadaceae bacterium]|nr:hypothetical protein [Gemmatimonadaceae bacterium]